MATQRPRQQAGVNSLATSHLLMLRHCSESLARFGAALEQHHSMGGGRTAGGKRHACLLHAAIDQTINRCAEAATSNETPNGPPNGALNGACGGTHPAPLCAPAAPPLQLSRACKGSRLARLLRYANCLETLLTSIMAGGRPRGADARKFGLRVCSRTPSSVLAGAKKAYSAPIKRIGST